MSNDSKQCSGKYSHVDFRIGLRIQLNNDGLTGISPESRAYFASIFNEQAGVDFGRPLGVIVLTPVFPRPALDTAEDNLYVHALSRESMLAREPSLYRIDLQLLAMAKDLARVACSTSITWLSPAALSRAESND